MYLSRIPLDIRKRKTQIALVSPNKIHGAVEDACLEKQKRFTEAKICFSQVKGVI